MSQARAVDVAYSDFASEIAALKASALAEDVDAGMAAEEIERIKAQWACTDRPDFYEAWFYLADAGTHYVVAIEPKPDICFEPGGESYGGGAVYEIDVKSYTILKKEMEE